MVIRSLAEEAGMQRFARLVATGALAALVTHALFLAVFVGIGDRLLASVNLFSIATYAFCVWLARRGRTSEVIAIAWVEVTAHAVLAIWRLGWESGFHFYFFVLLGALFLGPMQQWSRRLRTIGLAALLWGLYVGLDFLLADRPPAHTRHEDVVRLLRWFNLGSTFALLSYLWLYFADGVAAAEYRLMTMASTDTLSGLGNRRYAGRVMQEVMEAARRDGEPACLMLADIDDFKRLNDTHGHETGDRAIVQVSGLIRRACRRADRIARWGGEEFLVVLPDTRPAEAQRVAGRIHEELAAHPLRLPDGGSLPVTLTIGVAPWRAGDSVEQWVARADTALYAGKRAGKNRTELRTAA